MKNKSMITIKDIAKELGISHSTVSRALHDHPSVALKTKEKIKNATENMGYIPSAIARGLKTNRTYVLGVIITSFIDDPFFSEVLEGIESITQKAGYVLCIGASNGRLDKETRIVQSMGTRRADGLILCSTKLVKNHMSYLDQFNTPLVVIHNESTEKFPFTIDHDDRTGNYEITNYLLNLGHKKIAYLGNISQDRTNENRKNGVIDALREKKIKLEKKYFVDLKDSRPENGFTGINKLLSLEHLPTAIICFNDMMSIGVLSALSQSGFKVPQDISVVGFDNISISAYLEPPLTTFNQPKFSAGVEAANMLLALLDNKQNNSEIQIKPQKKTILGHLQVRSSTAKPPI